MNILSAAPCEGCEYLKKKKGSKKNHNFHILNYVRSIFVSVYLKEEKKKNIIFLLSRFYCYKQNSLMGYKLFATLFDKFSAICGTFDNIVIAFKL